MTTKGKWGRIEYNDFPSKICCLTGPESFVGDFFCVAETFLYPKGLWEREGRGEGEGEGWSITNSRRRFVVSHYRKTSYRNPSAFQIFRIWKTFMHKRGISQFTVKSFLTQSTEELRSGTLLCFSKFLVSRGVTDIRQLSRLPVKSFLPYRSKKIVGVFSCVPEKFGIKKVSR